MRLRSLVILLFAVVVGSAASAQLNYGGHAAPSLGVTLDIANDVLRSEIGTEVGMRSIGRDKNGAAPRSGLQSGTSGRMFGPNALFAAALQQPSAIMPVADTTFVRSATLQKKSEDGILAALAKRQPEAVTEYQRIFAANDMSRTFETASRAFNFRSNDVADTMAAYWLVAWVVANNAKEFSPAAARAVRDQVKAGIARTDVAGFSPEKKHQLADEAIFNMLVLTAVFQNKEIGKISGADYSRVGDATQRAFLGFGADLRQLKLTNAGFQK